MMEIALSFSGYLNDRTLPLLSKWRFTARALQYYCKARAVIDALLMFACHLTHESETAFS